MSKAAKPRPGALSKAFSGEVRAWRARKQWSVAELSERCGIKSGRLGYLLRDEVSWNLIEIESVARAFDLSPTQMLELAQAELAGHPERYPEPAHPADTVSRLQDHFDLVAKNPGREPDGDDEHFM